MSKGTQIGGVNISGTVGNVGGDIIGGNKFAIEDALRPVLDAITKGNPPPARSQAETALEAIRQELAKGAHPDDRVMARLLKELVGLIPAAASAVGSAFATPLLAALVGPATKLVLDKLGGKGA